MVLLHPTVVHRQGRLRGGSVSGGDGRGVVHVLCQKNSSDTEFQNGADANVSRAAGVNVTNGFGASGYLEAAAKLSQTPPDKTSHPGERQ